tara:strand:- start:2740 stop:2904 length:165 start_codon:yes stop_codon:yes gene_type:complete
MVDGYPFFILLQFYKIVLITGKIGICVVVLIYGKFDKIIFMDKILNILGLKKKA